MRGLGEYLPAPMKLAPIGEKKTSTWATLRLPLVLAACILTAAGLWFSTQFHTFTSSSSYDPLLKDVYNSTLGFEKIFVLNMASRTDRKDKLSLMGAYSNVKLEFLEPPPIDQVIQKATPGWTDPSSHYSTMTRGQLNSWRAHANALQRIVNENLSSALIMEDDVDWDYRIHSQLEQMALASRALTQPLRGQPSLYADATFRTNTTAQPASLRTAQIFPIEDLPQTQVPTTSPYGDNWDILHIGHCGTRSPILKVPDSFTTLASHLPAGHVLTLHDPTAPEPHHIHSYNNDNLPPFTTYVPGVNHSRIYHHAMDTICSSGYAVSQAGARKLLYHVGLRALDGPYDLMLESFCTRGWQWEESANCLTVQPAIMSQDAGIAGPSDMAFGKPKEDEEKPARLARRSIEARKRVARREVKKDVERELLVDKWANCGTGIRLSMYYNLKRLMKGLEPGEHCPDTHVDVELEEVEEWCDGDCDEDVDGDWKSSTSWQGTSMSVTMSG